MDKFQYVKDFENLGFGMFVHFGLYSKYGKGEWALNGLKTEKQIKEYENIFNRFNPAKNWAELLCKTAKTAGAKYITLTTRHHDGFSLYDTKGLSDYDAPHSFCKRDLIKEFVEACNKFGLVPFFYHTLLDWKVKSYKEDFKSYIDYLAKSIEVLCTNYGKIGGFWFDGMWDKPNEDWQENRIYSTIRKYQPTAMIINNTGLSELGKVGNYELDSVTFERGKPCFVDNSDRPRAGEMCQILCDHWGYCENDINYKAVKDIIGDLVDCRKYGCNMLLNVGPMGNGKLRTIDKCYLNEIGKWLKINKYFIYNAKPCSVKADNADILFDGKYYYAVVKNVAMASDINVQLGIDAKTVAVHENIKNAVWLDNEKKIKVKNGTFTATQFLYGRSLCIRVARFELDK